MFLAFLTSSINTGHDRPVASLQLCPVQHNGNVTPQGYFLQKLFLEAGCLAG